jgi:hypothetical protein
MILAQTIVDLCKSALDSEGGNRYEWDLDFKPAIQSAQDYAVTTFNSIFAKNKLSEENLRELMRMKIWWTSCYSRVAYDSTKVGENLWTIVSVNPKCTYKQNPDDIAGVPVVYVGQQESQYMPDKSFLHSNYSAKRLTREQWAEKERNPFMAGNPFVTCTDVMEYAYVNFTDYTGGYTLVNNEFEIEIAPAIPNEYIGISYLIVPNTVSLATDYLEFPEVMTNFLMNKTLFFLAYKQNDQTTLATMSNKDEKTLTELFS